MAKSALDLLKDYRSIIDEGPKSIVIPNRSHLGVSQLITSALNEGRVSVKSKEFDDKQAAEDAMEDYYRDYHPAGYGTSLKVVPSETPGKWIFTGYRYDSCD
jgi:hypothetical protein